MLITQQWSNRDLTLLRASEPKGVVVFHFSDHTTLRFGDGKHQFPEVDVSLLNHVARDLYDQLKSIFEGHDEAEDRQIEAA